MYGYYYESQRSKMLIDWVYTWLVKAYDKIELEKCKF